MLSVQRSGSFGRRYPASVKVLIAAMAALGASGCSADIARFDFGSNNLSEGSTGTIPLPSEDVGIGRSNLGNGEDGAAYAGSEVAPQQPASTYAAAPPSKIDMSALPEPAPATPGYGAPNPRPYAPEPRAFKPPASTFGGDTAASGDVPADEKGEQIEVRSGDTLYGLSKRHQVSLNELMRVNGLTSPALKPGQKLNLPSGKVAARQPVRSETAAVTPVDAPSDWTGSYTVKPGDSLYAIARQQKVKFTDLQRYNGIADVRRVRPGTVLKVPGIGGAVLAESASSDSDSAPLVQPPAPLVPPITETPVAEAPPAAPSAMPTILNSQRPTEQKVAELKTETQSDVIPVPGSGSVASTGKLRWPVKGRVIAGFGARSDGTHNDGINIAVPLGTEVHAAENGTVAYAGNELKGYGNLILVRHDNGWVTAYAHADEMMVKRGDKVSRGQVIAKAGKTGQVDQPQLHFEVRQGQKPVDPRPHLESN